MQQPCIVVVDRDPVFLELIDLLLEAHGYAMVGCRSPHAAQGVIRDAQPVLVLVDVRDGGDDANWLVVDLLRLDPATARLPVLLCSIDAEYLHAMAEHFELLGLACIAKPFRTVDLLCRLEREIRPTTARLLPPLQSRAVGASC